VQLESKLVGRTLPYSVLVPNDYEQTEKQGKRYPVLYLLHGVSGHYDNWFAKTKLTEYARDARIIIVTPEGGDGWYVDSATTPNEKFESHIIQELIPDVQKRFRTIEQRSGRAIAGLSMGGYGALKFGVKYPEAFSFVASLSGALRPATATDDELKDSDLLRRTIEHAFGRRDSETRSQNDLYKLFRELPAEKITLLPYIYFDCGTEDRFLPYNRAFVDVLLAKKIPHEYRQVPGNHDWKYWDQQVREVLRIFQARLVSK
jgi:S-formylglutathione hydrolase FrmB